MFRAVSFDPNVNEVADRPDATPLAETDDAAPAPVVL
jgi:hypothetical protein